MIQWHDVRFRTDGEWRIAEILIRAELMADPGASMEYIEDQLRRRLDWFVYGELRERLIRLHRECVTTIRDLPRAEKVDKEFQEILKLIDLTG